LDLLLLLLGLSRFDGIVFFAIISIDIALERVKRSLDDLIKDQKESEKREKYLENEAFQG
jgi:hypothetical protein